MNSKTAVSFSLLMLAPTMLNVISVAQAQSQTLTLTGTVVGRRDANEFWLRSYDRYYRVAGTAPFSLANGDRIRVSGAWKGGVLSGASWKSLQKSRSDLAPNRSVTGEVYRDLPGDEFQVKSYGGAIYRVLALKGKPKTFNRSDLVRALGRVRGGVLMSNEVIITAERTALAPAPEFQSHRAVVGTVTNNSKGNIFEIKTNGRRERVLSLFNKDPQLRVGDKVRLWAFWDGETGLWQASNLKKISGNAKGIGTAPNVSKNYGPQFRPSVIYGTVTALNGAKMTIRSNNGNAYPVQLLVARPALISVGTKVRVDGYWTGRIMRITKIQKWKG